MLFLMQLQTLAKNIPDAYVYYIKWLYVYVCVCVYYPKCLHEFHLHNGIKSISVCDIEFIHLIYLNRKTLDKIKWNYTDCDQRDILNDWIEFYCDRKYKKYFSSLSPHDFY